MDVDKKSEVLTNIDSVEQRYGGTYIGDFCLKLKNGNWSDNPAAIFYQPNPKIEFGHTHLFAIVNLFDGSYITCGDSAFSEPIAGIIADDGEVIYSRFRHDYRTSADNSVFIDGGRDYCRHSGDPTRFCTLILDKDKLVIDPESVNILYR